MTKRLISFDTAAQDGALPDEVEDYLDEKAGGVAGLVAGWAADAVGGRNLIVRRDEEVDRWVDTQGDVTYYKDHSLVTIPVSPGETFTFTKSTSGFAPDGGFFRYGWYDEEGEFVFRIANSSNEFTVTVPGRAASLKVSYPNDSFPKLERGPWATPWTPAPEDLGSHVQGGDPLDTFPSPLPPADPGLQLRVDNSVGTRVFVGDTMIYGDTGWRIWTEGMIDGWLGKPFLRRIGSRVYLSFSSTDALRVDPDADTTNHPFVNIPNDFRGGSQTLGVGYLNDGYGANPVWAYGTSSLSTATRPKQAFGNLTWTTSRSWPTTLPGTPA